MFRKFAKLKQTTKLGLQIFLGLVLSSALLYLTFHKVDLVLVWQKIKEVKLLYILLYVGFTLVVQLARVYRFALLVKPFAKLSNFAAYRVANFGALLICVLPLRLGEFARPYLLKQESGVPLSSGIGAVMVERTIDGLILTLSFFLLVFSLDDHYVVPMSLKVAALLTLGAFVGVALLIVLTLLKHDLVHRFMHRFGDLISKALVQRILNMLDGFVVGLRSFPDRYALLLFSLWTVVIWGASALSMYVLFFGFGWDLPFNAGFILVCITMIGIMIPAGPGFLGTFQGAILLGLAIFHIDFTEAAAYSTIAYPLMLLVNLALGLPYFFMGKGTADRQLLDFIEGSPENECCS